MRILGFDTTSKHLSVSISDGENMLTSIHEDVGVRHSSLLLPKIEELLKEQNLTIKDIDVIAISIGPGSFTGLRIGVAIAKAFALSTGIRIVSIPTMDLIAYNYIDKGDKLIPCLDARKEMIYFCIYKKEGDLLLAQTDYMLSDINALTKKIGQDKAVLFGDGVKLYKDILKGKCPHIELVEDENWFAKAEDVVKLGYEKAIKGEYVNADELVPMYLHPSDCHIRKG